MNPIRAHRQSRRRLAGRLLWIRSEAHKCDASLFRIELEKCIEETHAELKRNEALATHDDSHVRDNVGERQEDRSISNNRCARAGLVRNDHASAYGAIDHDRIERLRMCEARTEEAVGADHERAKGMAMMTPMPVSIVQAKGVMTLTVVGLAFSADVIGLVMLAQWL
jgi:hypothetical protein